MKKMILGFLSASALLLLTGYVNLTNEFPGAASSGEQTSDAAISTTRGFITGVEVITDGTNNATVVIYDNTAASGTVIGEFTVVGGNHFGGRNFIIPVRYTRGLYADVTGTGASYIIEYTER